MNNEVKPLRALSVNGPTASGKTALSLALAEHFLGELISCDSMQIYRGMDVGTAKATAAEQARARHHMIDVAEPTENYSVESYRAAALAAVREITARGRLPIFVGGTGLYVDALLRRGQEGVPESDHAYREKMLSEYTPDALWQRLSEVDPESAAIIHKNNVKRVLRALEIFDMTGVTKTELDRLSREGSPEIAIGMTVIDFHNRELLYRRIDERVDVMIDMGLVAEVEGLLSRGLLPEGSTAAQAIGYKELVRYLEGTCPLDEAIDGIKLASRRYAKRQLTWFRHKEGARIIYRDTEDGALRPEEEFICEAVGVASELLEKITQ